MSTLNHDLDLINRIAEASRRPFYGVRKSIHKNIGWVYVTADGCTTCNKPGGFDTADEAIAHFHANQDKLVSQFRAQLLEMNQAGIERQADYWLCRRTVEGGAS